MRVPIRFKVALSIVTIFLLTVVALGAAGSRIASGRIRQQLSERIEGAFQAFRQGQRNRFQMLRAEAQGLVNTVNLKAVVNTKDAPTVWQTVDEIFPNIQAEFMAVVSDEGEILDARISHYEQVTAEGKTFSRKVPEKIEEADSMAVEKAGRLSMVTAVLTGERDYTENNVALGGRIFQAVAFPVHAPADTQEGGSSQTVIGALLLGYALTDQLADDLAKTTGSDVIFLSDGEIIASSGGLDPQAAGRLTEQAEGLDEQGELVLAERGSEAETLGITHPVTRLVYRIFSNGTYLYRSGPIRSVTEEGTVQIGSSVILQSLDKAWTGYWEVGAYLVLIATMLVAAGIVILIVFASRYVTRPIHELADGTARVAAGDFDTKIVIGNRDELGDLAAAFNSMTDGLREKFTMQKFVSSATLSAVKQAASAGVDRAGKRTPVTVFFSDIRGFTSFSEKVTPERVIAMLNRYLQRQAEIISSHGGDVDKFVGDEVMAVFKGPDKELRSVKCAIEIQREMAKINRDDPGAEGLAIGIGLNSGEVVEGAMGSSDRMDFTILGSNVNLGARLCSQAGPHEILLSASTYDPVASILGPTDTVSLKLKGIDGEVTVYRLKPGPAA